MTRPEVLEVLARFTAAWGSYRLTPQAIELWCEALEPINASWGEAAANALISESEFFPAVAKFKGRARDFARRDDAFTDLELDAPRLPRTAIKVAIGHARGILAGDHTGDDWKLCAPCRAANPELLPDIPDSTSSAVSS